MLYCICETGEAPIEKNIRVVDALGNEYEATCPKRAKGLVKQGRAHFISENTSCLACPPKEKKNLEDINMKNAEMTAKTELTEEKRIRRQSPPKPPPS